MAFDRHDPDAAVPRPEDPERAVELFARLLESGDDPLHLDPARFDELLRRHPELRDELLLIRDGMEKFALVRRQLPRLEVVRGGRQWRWVGAWIAAAAVVALAAWWIHRGNASAPAVAPTPTASRPAPSVDPEVVAAQDRLLDAGLVYLEQSLRRLPYIDPMPPAPPDGGGAATNVPPDPVLVARGEHSVDEIVNVLTTVDRLQSLPRNRASSAAEARLDAVRDQIETTAPEYWKDRLRTAFSNPDGSISNAAPLLLALTRDPKLRATLLEKQEQGTLPQVIAEIADAARSPARLRLKAIDLDRGGAEITGATIFVQSIDPVTGIIGPPTALGATPVDAVDLLAGDWRITVVESSQPGARHSELRLLAMPGEDLGTRVAFFRAIPDPTKSMVHLSAASFHFGKPPSARRPNDSDLPYATETLDDFWIDRDEVTCQEYSDFFLEVQAHPDWFEGSIAPHRPRVLQVDGTPPVQIARFPIVDVTWEEAVVCANWAGKRLPTEREWERAARGTVDEDRVYPWGNKFAPPGKSCVNLGASISPFAKGPLSGPPPKSFGTTVPPAVLFLRLVGADVDDRSVDDGATPGDPGAQIHRMADNAAEFVEDLYVEMQGSVPGLQQSTSVARVVKGSSWLTIDEFNCANGCRGSFFPEARLATHGFRCVKTTKPGFGSK